MRTHPHLFEINTWPWLTSLSRAADRPITLATVPEPEWDALRRQGIDIVYLMGVWKRSTTGREGALTNLPLFDALDRALPDWTADDVPGSAYSIAGYEVDPRLGTWDDLAEARSRLHARGMQLVVDFIPNHTGFDHPWIRSHPDRFVQADLAAFRNDPAAFRAVETGGGAIAYIACGRDPFFPPWNDVAQLDYSNRETRGEMIAELERLARHADGVRCDMAMLELTEVFHRTWTPYLRHVMPSDEFWSEARVAVRNLVMIAEVYWDLEWRLQELGFDFTYDKRLYDRLRNSSAPEVRGHLTADPEYQRRSARFIENHDEDRSATAFPSRVHAAATVMATVPGLRFFHQGQFEGRRDRLPVQLGRWREEPADATFARFYERLLAAVNHEVFHSGQWQLLDVHPVDGQTSEDLVAWQWSAGGELRVIAVNLGPTTAHGLLQISLDRLPPAAETIGFDDLLNRQEYSWSRLTLARGLYVKLAAGEAHLFRVTEGG